MPSNQYDISYRMDRIGNMIEPKRGEYVCNIAQMLFNLVPGQDEYDPERGLNIRGKLYQPFSNGARDPSYESEIMKQFNKYTDLIPANVIAIYLNGQYHVYMDVTYRNQVYMMDIAADADTLTAVLRDDSRGKELGGF